MLVMHGVYVGSAGQRVGGGGGWGGRGRRWGGGGVGGGEDRRVRVSRD